MPRRPNAPPVGLPAIPAELLEPFGNGPITAESNNAATMDLKKALIEHALGGEMNHYLGYSPGEAKPAAVTNQRNGKGAKTVLTEDGPIRIEVLRDRGGSFAPLLIPKHERRFTDFDEKIVAMYARGMTVREVQTRPWTIDSFGHPRECYPRVAHGDSDTLDALAEPNYYRQRCKCSCCAGINLNQSAYTVPGAIQTQAR